MTVHMHTQLQLFSLKDIQNFVKRVTPYCTTRHYLTPLQFWKTVTYNYKNYDMVAVVQNVILHTLC